MKRKLHHHSLPGSSVTVFLGVLCLLLALFPADVCAQQQSFQTPVATVKTNNVLASIHLATDGKGNIFFTQFSQNQPGSGTSFEETPKAGGGYSEAALPFPGSDFGALAVDATGKLYFTGTNGGSFIQIETPSGLGTYTATSITNLGNPGAVAIDAAGDIFAIDNVGGYRINEEIPTGGGNYNHVVLVAPGVIQGVAVGLSVDDNGNVYFADSSNSGSAILYKLTATGNTFVQSVVATLTASVSALTVDTSGNVYAAGSDGRVYKETPAGAVYTQSVVLSEFYSIAAMVVLPDSSLVVSGGLNLQIVKETPAATVVGSAAPVLPAQVTGAPTAGTAQFTFNNAATLAASPFVVNNPDFSLPASQPQGACTAGQAYAAGATCSVAVSFAASSPGTRAGAVTLYAAGGQVLGSSLLNATGTAPLALLYPGLASTLISGLPNQLTGIALDAAGNLYLADGANNRVLKETLSNGTYIQSVVTSNVSNPAAVAVDGAGNVYIADAGNSRFLRETPSGPGYLESNLLTGYQGYIAQPFDVAVDALGDVFVGIAVLNGSAQVVIKESPNNNVYTGTVILPSTRALNIRDFAVDGPGNVYLLAQSPDTIYREAPGTANTYTESSFPTSGYNGSLAADQTGNLYLASNGGIERIGYSSGAYASPFVVPNLSNNYTTITGVAPDPQGRLYFLTATGNYNSFGVGLYDPSQHPTLTYPGQYNVGATSAPLGATLANAGNVGLNFFAPGPNPALSSMSFFFDSTATCPQATASNPASLAAGASCLAAIDFAPRQAGLLTSNLTFTDNSLNATSATQVVSLTGLAVGGLSIAPGSLSFPATAVGSTSGSLTATITNSGGAVTLTAGSLTDTKDFSSSTNCAGALAANASCTVTFTFMPQSIGTIGSAFSIADANNPGVVLTVTLSGTGMGTPTATLSPTTLAYTATSGVQSPSQIATLTNSGTAPLAIASFGVSGTNASVFNVASTTCGATLAAGASCYANISFTPATTGSFSASLTVTDNSSSGTTQTIALTGTGTAPAVPQAVLTPTTVDFGNVAAGSTAPAKIFTLSNPGIASLPITSVSIVGANASSFTATSTCGSTLAAGAACSVSVTFSPASAGGFAASLSVVDSVGTQSSSLTGTGLSTNPPDFSLTPTPASISTYRGTGVTYSIQAAALLANNPFTSPVTLSIAGLPPGATASFSPAIVVPGVQASTILTVTVPALSAAATPPLKPGTSGRNLGLSFAVLLAGACIRLRRNRRLPRLIALLALCGFSGLALPITGCGTGTGFAVPTSSYLLTVTGTSGTTVHSTTVKLIIQ